MSKRLLAVLALALCVAFAAACGGTEQHVLSVKDDSANAYSQGGFLAETDKYAYFINGIDDYTAINDGSAEKGALVRVEKSKLGTKDVKAEIVVSKLLASGDYTAGISIYDGRIYFATPNEETNKVGTVQNDQLKFCSVKLDGSDLKTITTTAGTAGNSAAYRFVKSGNDVYVVYVSTESVDDETKNYINVVKADGTSVAKEEYATYIFPKGESFENVYFTRSVIRETGEETEDFNQVMRLKIGEDKAVSVLYGAGPERSEEDGITYAKSAVSFTLIAAQNGNLYLSVAAVSTTPAAVTHYDYIAESDLAYTAPAADSDKSFRETREANYDKLTQMTYNGSATVFASTSIYEAPQKIVYIDSTKGLCSYNYDKADSFADYNGTYVEFYNSDITTATILYVKEGKLYYSVNGVVYRIPYDATAECGSMVSDDTEAEKLSTVAFSTSWYSPETVKGADDKEYIVGVPAGTDYKNYVFALEVIDGEDFDKEIYAYEEGEEGETLVDAFGIHAFVEELIKDKTDAEKKDVWDGLDGTKYGDFISGTGRYNVKYLWTKTVSYLSESARASVDEAVDTAYPDSSASASSSTEEEGGCSSGITGASLAAFAFIGAAVCIKKRV